MAEWKKPQSVVIIRDCSYTSGLYGNRQFLKGERLNIVFKQKEDYTKAGISKVFVKTLILNKQIKEV